MAFIAQGDVAGIWPYGYVFHCSGLKQTELEVPRLSFVGPIEHVLALRQKTWCSLRCSLNTHRRWLSHFPARSSWFHQFLCESLEVESILLEAWQLEWALAQALAPVVDKQKPGFQGGEQFDARKIKWCLEIVGGLYPWILEATFSTTVQRKMFTGYAQHERSTTFVTTIQTAVTTWLSYLCWENTISVGIPSSKWTEFLMVAC